MTKTYAIHLCTITHYTGVQVPVYLGKNGGVDSTSTAVLFTKREASRRVKQYPKGAVVEVG
jgi:cAMP phosphodiesterase